MFGWSYPAWTACLLATFSQAGMCQGLRDTCFLEQEVRILHNRAHSGPYFMAPSLFIEVITAVLSVAISTILFEKWSWNSLDQKTVFSSR